METMKELFTIHYQSYSEIKKRMGNFLNLLVMAGEYVPTISACEGVQYLARYEMEGEDIAMHYDWVHMGKSFYECERYPLSLVENATPESVTEYAKKCQQKRAKEEEDRKKKKQENDLALLQRLIKQYGDRHGYDFLKKLL